MKTAVEWFVDQLTIIQQESLKYIIEQAKEMEKEQIYYAYQQGLMDVIPMDYYHNTFKSE